MRGLHDTDAVGATSAPARPPAKPRTDAGTAGVLLAVAAAAEGGPAAALTWEHETLISRLAGQMERLGASTLHVITRPEYEPAVRDALGAIAVQLVTSPDAAGDLREIAAVARDSGPGGVVVALADIVTQREALAGLLLDPRYPTGILVTPTDSAIGDLHAPSTRSARGRVVSAGSAYHTVQDPSERFLGVLKVAPADAGAVVDAADRLSALAPRLAAADDDAAALLLVGLVRSGVYVGNILVRRLFWARPLSREAVDAARVAIEHYDEERALLDSAVKPEDGFFTTYFVSPYSKYIARWAARAGLTPNQVTTLSLLVGMAAAAAFATGERAGLVAGALLLHLAFTLDCVDGQLARYTRTFSNLGAWLDSVFDRTKEYLVFAGLAIGASQAGDPVWLLAGAALTLQVVRHTVEFSWDATMHQHIGATEHPPIEQPGDGAPAARRAEVDAPPRGGVRKRLRTAVSAWTRLDRSPKALWAKRIAAFPIGERFAVIAITAAFTTPRTVFIVLLACGGLAALYSLTGRVLRSLAA
jgi:hypothetical protein